MDSKADDLNNLETNSGVRIQKNCFVIATCYYQSKSRIIDFHQHPVNQTLLAYISSKSWLYLCVGVAKEHSLINLANCASTIIVRIVI